MASDRQLAANRANARKSTGPRTGRGKSVSSMNALKSGIYAKSRLLPYEDPAEYEALRDGYYRDFAPANTDESELLDDLIANRWKVRRLQAAYDDFWNCKIDSDRKSPDYRTDYPLVRPFNGASEQFAKLRRELSAAERDFHRARNSLLKAQHARRSSATSRTTSSNLASFPHMTSIAEVPGPSHGFPSPQPVAPVPPPAYLASFPQIATRPKATRSSLPHDSRPLRRLVSLIPPPENTALPSPAANSPAAPVRLTTPS